MAERYEVIIDFEPYAPGTTIDLLNAPLPNNQVIGNTDKVMRFVVGTAATDPAKRANFDANNRIPASFYTPLRPDQNTTFGAFITPQEVMGLTAAQARQRRSLAFERHNVSGRSPVTRGTRSS